MGQKSHCVYHLYGPKTYRDKLKEGLTAYDLAQGVCPLKVRKSELGGNGVFATWSSMVFAFRDISCTFSIGDTWYICW